MSWRDSEVLLRLKQLQQLGEVLLEQLQQPGELLRQRDKHQLPQKKRWLLKMVLKQAQKKLKKR